MKKILLLSLFSCISYGQHVFLMNDEGKCSGYKLNENTILTAKHCVKWNTTHYVLEDKPGSFFERYDVSRTDIENDLAILVREGQKEEPIRVELFGQAEIGEKVCSYGHAEGAPELTKMCDIIVDHEVKSESVLHGLFFLTKYKIIQGMSGGAVLNVKGQIVGVNSFNISFKNPLQELAARLLYPNMGYSGVVASQEIRNFVLRLTEKPIVKYF